MDNPIIEALRRARQAYMTNVGEPTAQLVGGGVRGYLGLDAPEYADSRGMEAYRNAQAIANTPVVGVPAMAARAGTRAAPAVAKALREHSKGFQEYNRALGPAGASQAIVWHGSPHKFDRFDASKIGTGEGAQAYGHGLYLAESPGVARQYAENVKDMGAVQRINAELSQLSKIMASDEIPGSYRKYRTDAGREAAKRYDELMASRESVRQAPGQMYKVDLPDEKIARMLDWDKPLSQQAPEVQAALNKLPADVKAHIGIGKYDDLKGGIDIVKPLGGLVGDAKVPGMLRQAGIPGIRYLDQGSRQFASDAYAGLEKTQAKVARLEAEFAKNPSQALQSRLEDARQELMSAKRGVGDLSSNFVVFPGEEAALTILERNNEIINALRKKKQQ